MSNVSAEARKMLKEFETVIDIADSMPQHVHIPNPRKYGVDWYTQEVDAFNWRVRFGYRVTQEGLANSRRNMGPDADGQNAEVEIVDAILCGFGKDLDLPLSMFSRDQLAEARDEIEAKLNSED